MGINKDLNVDPYYDDYDEKKQFNRVLFTPSKAVQARELTQLQTILQKQVERFGSNIYKEGTVISGVNLTARDDLFYVKIKDQVGFTQPSLYDEVFSEDGSSTRFLLRGTSGLRAEIVKGLGGFETSAPNLKTFYINYLNSATGPSSTDVKQFGVNESLSLLDSNENPVLSDGNPITLTTSETVDHVGRAFGISCEPGVIYQKGHFLFVDRQFTIVTRYSSIPGQDPTDPSIVNPMSVGFTVEENLVNSNQDRSLLDNAAGYNNYNAPGADRLQLLPKLIAYSSTNEPEDFFALIRYRDGKQVRLRDYTQYSLLGEELSRRTYEESGNYVIDGLDATLESPVTITNDIGGEEFAAQVSISPGKAYVFGKEVRNVSANKITLDKVTSTQTKSQQLTTVDYDQHFEFVATNGTTVIDFDITGDTLSSKLPQYVLLSGTTTIGTCCVRNVEPGKIYVFNVVKEASYERTAPTHIGLSGYQPGDNRVLLKTNADTTPTGQQKVNEGCMVFDSGKGSIKSITSTNLVERVRKSDFPLVGRAHTIATSADGVPVKTDDIFAIVEDGSGNSEIYTPSSVEQLADGALSEQASDGRSDGITVTFASLNSTQQIKHLYYSRVVEGTSEDSLSEATGYVRTGYDPVKRTASLGLPNVIEVIRVLCDTDVQIESDPFVDVTSKFRLVSNQKDAFYDISYLQLKSGASLPPSNSLIVEVRYLERQYSNGYLTANSYTNVTNKHLVKPYTAKNLKTYTLTNCYDLRPYAVKKVIDVASGPGSALSVTPQETRIFRNTAPSAKDSVINSTQEYYLNRIDSVVLDEYGEIRLIKGAEAESPVKPKLDRLYEIAEIVSPGNTISVQGVDSVFVKSRKNKTYTMKDIEQLEMKIDILTESVALTMAEINAKNLIITGSDGVDRFKNGILTDTFESLMGASLGDPQFSAAVDKTRTVAMPAVRQFPIDLKIDSSTTSGVSNETAANSFDEITTLNQLPKVSFIDQPYATNFRNCVSNYYNYRGNVGLHPKFVSGYDVIQNPKIDIEFDIAGPMMDLVENIQEFLPLTREEVLGTELESWSLSGGWYTLNQLETTEVTGLTATESSLSQAVGNFVTDVNMKPFLASQIIKVLVTGLRPNTRHYFWFDQKDVNVHISPGAVGSSMKASDVRSGHASNKGQAVRTDSKGRLAGFFYMPAETFFVGENILEVADVDQYGSIDSGSTSYGRTTFRGYNFAINKTEVNTTTRTVDFDTDVSIVERRFQQFARDPIAQTFRVKSAASKGADYVYISDIDVYFKRVSSTTGVTLQIRETVNGYPSKNVLPFGEKVLDPITDQILVSDDGTAPTNFKFDNPVKLKADSEYTFVVIPDANSPEYLIYTSKVGETSLSEGSTAKSVAVTNDWGDGALFTSTNDSAWRSYQDEDLKFTINRHDFVSEGSVELVPNDVEFLTIRENATDPNDSTKTTHFEVGELVYALTDNRSFQMAVGGSDSSNPNEISISSSSLETDADDDGVADSVYDFADGDYVLVQSDNISLSDRKAVTRILSQRTEGLNKIYTLEDPYTIYDTSEGVGGFGDGVVVKRCVAGKVSHYDPKNIEKLHLGESSARVNNFLDSATPVTIGFGEGKMVDGNTYTIVNLGNQGTDSEIAQAWEDAGVPDNVTPAVGVQFVASAPNNSTIFDGFNGTARPNDQVINGVTTGASAKITTVDEVKLSYFQPQIQIDNSSNTSSSLELRKSVGGSSQPDKPISSNSNVYTTNNLRTIKSKSKQIVDSDTIDPFRIKVNLNSSISTVTPMMDVDMAELNAYQYKITTVEATTSNWVTKEVILNDLLPAKGLKVKLSAYRPPGTFVDVYGRFVYPNNSEGDKSATADSVGNNNSTEWKKLVNANPDLYSNTSNTRDYKEFEYDLDETVHTDDFTTFQIRVVMRLGATGLGNELDTPQLRNLVPDIHLAPTIYDLTAVAVT